MNIIPLSQRHFITKTTAMNYLVLPQNGVVEGALHFGPGNSSLRRVPMTSSMEPPRGIVVPTETPPKRPMNLPVSPLPNDYAMKGCRDDGEADGTSLPCTPELQSDSEADVSGCPAADKVLDSVTRHLIVRFLTDFIAHKETRWGDSKTLATMKRVVDEMLEKHKYAYNGMVKRLSLVSRVDNAGFMTEVSKSLFDDGTTNWGRIASLVAFGALVCQYLQERDGDSKVELVGQEISTYLLTHQRDWLVKNNSWDGFVEFFRVSDPEASVRNTLLSIVGFASIGATLALLIR